MKTAISSFGHKISLYYRKFANFKLAHPVIITIIDALLLNIIVEALSRHSLIKVFTFALSCPFNFAYNFILILFTLSIAMFLPKREYARNFISLIWLALGIINFSVLCFRTTPFSAIEFELITSIWTMASIYFSNFQIVLIAIGIALLLAALIFGLIKSKNHKLPLKGAISSLILSGIVLYCATVFGMSTGALSSKFPNLPSAYREYGFAYCFTSGIIDRGISRPDGYSAETIDSILNTIHTDEDNTVTDKPNIVFVQLESFFDPSYISTLSYSEDPTPNFTKLKESCSTGLLTVPSIGSGTANTEFEVLSGMSLDYFGTGEYPYKTILQNSSCESICYNLKELGYSAHAIHNHYGSFYDRNLVYSNLGFDTFTSLEYMQNTSNTPRGWTNDDILTDEIMNSLNSTEEQDFIFTISVQAHGRYATSYTSKYPFSTIHVSGIEDEAETISMQYYLDQLHGTDAFVGDLVDTLSDYDEDTIVVFYGDHLPSFEIDESTLSKGNLYQTEYVIWSNFDLKKQDENLYSYQLNAYVLERLGINNGIITKLHQQYSNDLHYESAMELLEYDMLYGDKDAYRGDLPAPTDIKMGTFDITVKKVTLSEDMAYISGKNFTKWSNVCVNGERCETTYYSPVALGISIDDLEDDCEITIEQAGKDKDTLSSSDTFHFVMPETDATDTAAASEALSQNAHSTEAAAASQAGVSAATAQ